MGSQLAYFHPVTFHVLLFPSLLSAACPLRLGPFLLMTWIIPVTSLVSTLPAVAALGPEDILCAVPALKLMEHRSRSGAAVGFSTSVPALKPPEGGCHPRYRWEGEFGGAEEPAQSPPQPAQLERVHMLLGPWSV